MKDNLQELFPVVDEEGTVIGQATRGECHNGSRLLHAVVHLHVFNSQGEVYLQKRPEWKDIQPGKWDTAVGGHIDYGETPEEALRREVREELGIADFTPEFVGKYVFDSKRERELVYVNRTIFNGPIQPSKDELDGGRFWTVQDIREAMGKDVLTPNFEREFEQFFCKFLIKLNNNIEIPQIGVGTWTLRGETARQNVRLALEAGFRHIDTAQSYENEAEVGQGILDSGVPRKDLFVTTKVNTDIMRQGQLAVRKSIDESLEKLKTDYIDLLLIHWPVKDCVKHTWQAMEDYVRQGKVRSIGVSNFNRHHLDELLSYAEVRPVINQIEVHPLMTQEDNIAYNHSLGIEVEAWGPFGQGDIDVVGHPLLQQLAQKYEKTASQIVLRWIVQRGLITIPRAKPNHFAENLEIMTFSLSDEDMQAISGLNQNLRSNVLNDPETFPW